MIQAEHLSKKYGDRTVVSDVSMRVAIGDVLGFIGPNGAGKTTTIKMLCGVMPVYAGTVRIGGFDIGGEARRAKSLIGYLPENAPLPPNTSVRAFLKYVAAMRGIPHKNRDEALAKAADRCALVDVLGEEIESLSKGYKRRVCLAQAIIHEPKALILDEPTDGLDPIQKREVRNLIQLLRRHTAVIISTHILEEVRAVCSRVLLLSHGKIAFAGDTEGFMRAAVRNGGAAFRVPDLSVPDAAMLFRTAYPGLAKLDGNCFVLPLDRIPGADEAEKIAFVSDMLKNAGIESVCERRPDAELDDVFASLALTGTGSEARHD